MTLVTSPPTFVRNVVYLYTVRSVPQRTLEQKWRFYCDLFNLPTDDPTVVDYTEELLRHAEDTQMHSGNRWLTFCEDLSPLATFGLRLTQVNVVNPIEYQFAEAVARYLAPEQADDFLSQLNDYWSGRSGHKVYGNIPLAFDCQGSWIPTLTQEQYQYLTSSHLDDLACAMFTALTSQEPSAA